VAATATRGHRNTVAFVIPGLAVEEKAEAALAALWDRVGPPDDFDAVEVRLERTEHTDPGSHEASFATLRVTVTDADPDRVGRAFSNSAVELALATYPGFLLTAPPGPGSPHVLYWPSVVRQPPSVVAVGDEVIVVPPTSATDGDAGSDPPPPAEADPPVEVGATVNAPLGTLVGARSGDKGGDANVGVWARDDAGYDWLRRYLTVDRLRRLIPEAADLDVERHVLPRIRGLNFVLAGYLGEGAASSSGRDPQAKALGEYLRAKTVEIPVDLVGR
jgi:hypothetical protein